MISDMHKIKLTDQERHGLAMSIKKIIGQLQSISQVIENNQITEQTFTQLLAVKGGASKVCKDIIAKGVLTQIQEYSQEELDNALNIIFKLG
jgi:DNA-binding FrmR family transcriptional regulator